MRGVDGREAACEEGEEGLALVGAAEEGECGGGEGRREEGGRVGVDVGDAADGVGLDRHSGRDDLKVLSKRGCRKDCTMEEVNVSS